MKQLIALSVLLVLAGPLFSQNSRDSVNYFKKNYSRLNLEYFVFYEAQLIGCMIDTTYRIKFERDIINQKRRIGNSGSDESKERRILLNILYKRIEEVDVISTDSLESKHFLLAQLEQFKDLQFPVDFKLVERRLNPTKRGLPFGDEECDTDYSKFIFFIYDPQLYINVIVQSRVANPSGKIVFPTKCFLEELALFPKAIKVKTQSELLKIISEYPGKDFETLRKLVQSADLDAHYN